VQVQNHTLEFFSDEQLVKFSLKWLFGAVAAAAFFIWSVLAFTVVEYGENQASVNWLPKSATNVSYYQSYAFTAYEFAIPEAEFLKWSGKKLMPIDETISIPRYCFPRTKVPVVGPNPTVQELDNQMQVYESRTAQVANGLHYTHRRQNGGGVIVAYDRDRGKAFFWSSPR
jgi:hypothetical protein